MLGSVHIYIFYAIEIKYVFLLTFFLIDILPYIKKQKIMMKEHTSFK